MFIATVVAVLVLAAALVASAGQKLRGSPTVVASYAAVGVPPARLPLLAAVLLGAAVGVVVGLGVAWLGVAAAAGVVVYFLLAVVAHVRHRQLSNVATPTVILALALVALALRLATV
jgi:hypothetical protein